MSRKRGAALGIHSVHGAPPPPTEVARDLQQKRWPQCHDVEVQMVGWSGSLIKIE